MELRIWFLRDVVDAIERDHTGNLHDRLRERLPQRLAKHLDGDRLRNAAPTDTVSLDDGEELLLAIDMALGNGSGRVLENAALGLTTRMLSQGGGVVVVGDLFGTVRRLRAPLERPFVGLDLVFQLAETDTGFSLTLGIPGRPRSARMLRHIGVGTIRAAHRFSHETSDAEFKLYAEVAGDRANISARYRQPVSEPGEGLAAPAPGRRRTRRMRSLTQPGLAAEVDRILGHGQSTPPDAPRRHPSTIPPPRTSLISDVPPEHSPSGVHARGAAEEARGQETPAASGRGAGNGTRGDG